MRQIVMASVVAGCLVLADGLAATEEGKPAGEVRRPGRAPAAVVVMPGSRGAPRPTC